MSTFLFRLIIAFEFSMKAIKCVIGVFFFATRTSFQTAIWRSLVVIASTIRSGKKTEKSELYFN